MRISWRTLFGTACCLMAFAVPGSHPPQRHMARAARAGQTVPVLRFAIDNDYYPEKQSVAQAAADFALLHSIGVKILRVGMGWDDTNPAPRVYNWGFWRALVRRAAAAGIEVRPYYLYPPSWAADHWNDPPRQPADYGRACGMMARELRPWVRYYEVWNEVDQNIFWTGTQAQYLAALRACAGAIRATQPGAKIVLAGLTSLNADWINALNHLGGKRLYDVVAFHTYAEAPWDSTPVESYTTPGNSAPYSYAWSWDIASDHGRLPVWMNEGGASTADDFVDTEYSQASWVRRMLATLLSTPGRPIALFGLYQVRDLDPALSTPIGDQTSVTFYRHTGVFTSRGRPKLAAHTYADLVRLLDGHRPAIENGVSYTPTTGIASGVRLHAWRLETGTQLIMLWDTLRTSRGTLRLASRGGAAFLHAPDGTVRPVAGFDGRTIPQLDVRGGAMPLLYEIRPATGSGYR